MDKDSKIPKPLDSLYLTKANVKKVKFRSIGLLLIVAVFSFLLFGGTLLILSLKNGIKGIQERFGADLIVIPKGAESSYQSILLKGEPDYFYMDKSVESQVREIRGVEKATSQFFVTSTGEECCGILVQIIGYDDETDFAIKPWIASSFRRRLKDGEVVVGNTITPENGKVMLFGTYFPVAAKLSSSGTGLDSTVFANKQTVFQIVEASYKKNFHLFDDVDFHNVISSVLVRVEKGRSPAATAVLIRSKIPGVQVLTSENILSSISNSLGAFVVFFYLIAAILLVSTFVTLTIVFSMSINERQKELSVLRILGMSLKKLRNLILQESFFITSAGAAIGIGVSALFIIPFSYLIGSLFGMPYSLPSIWAILLTALAALVISAGLGILAAVFAAKKIGSAESYTAMREGE